MSVQISYINEKIKPEQVRLCKEFHKIIEFTRSIFEDDIRIQKILSIEYENVIWSKLKLIPIVYIPDVLKITNMVIEGLQCIDINAVILFLTKYNLSAKFDSKQFILEFVSNTDMISPKIASLILNLLEVCDKLFICFNILINDPLKYLSKLYKKETVDLLK